MFSTSITRTFGLTTPIVNAGMAMIARPALAAAVCEAGGLGTIGSDINPPDVLRDLVRQTKALTKRPFGVDLIGDFVTDEDIAVLIEEQVALAVFFWTLPTVENVARLKRAGVKVWMQIGRVAEADQAVALRADALIVQGAEAGGHNRAEASTMTLFPRIRGRFPGLPLLAAGGIVDGAAMAAALVLGADAVWCGSRFLASQEAEAHDAYKDRVLSADVGDTAILSIYGPEWPGHGRSSMTEHAWRWGGKARPSRMRQARSLARRSSTARRSRRRAIAPSCRRGISMATSSRLA
jgi:NAD(P)H-dependent flavin oxidoreductase YrpB (nitropropane dioxygenase family)